MPETYYNAAEIQMMLDEFGVDVTISGITAKGIVDRVDEEEAVGYQTHQIGKSIMVTGKTGTWPALAVEIVAIVDGVTYRVVQIMQIEDGALVKFVCATEL